MVDPDAQRLLTLAVTADGDKRYVAAINFYREGVQMLYDGIQGIGDPKLKTQIKNKAHEYLSRAEELKKMVDQEKAKDGTHVQITIADGDVGHGLETTFSPYINSDLTQVEIDEPYVRANHQIQTFLRFCAILLKHSKNIQTIHLKTNPEPKPEARQNQLTRLDEIREGLLRRRVKLLVEYSETLHDREIRFNNGYTIKIGRGLDYFKRPESQNTVDFVELDFRPCTATTVDVYYSTPKSRKSTK